MNIDKFLEAWEVILSEREGVSVKLTYEEEKGE